LSAVYVKHRQRGARRDLLFSIMDGTRMETPSTDPSQRHAQQLATFLSLYRPLVDGLVKEFFIDGYWTNLPASWRAPLDALSFQDLADLLMRPTCSAPAGVVWPLSLLAFMATVHALRLPGQFEARGGTEELPDEATNDLAASMAGLNASDADLRGPTGASWANNQRKSADGRCAEEQYIGIDLRLAVKPKKMHEIIHLVSLTLTLTLALTLALTLTLTLTPTTTPTLRLTLTLTLTRARSPTRSRAWPGATTSSTWAAGKATSLARSPSNTTGRLSHSNPNPNP
jgi:hypothetical protein